MMCMATGCPLCKSADTRLMKEWIYGPYYVMRFHCNGCTEDFNTYSRDGVEAFTIPQEES